MNSKMKLAALREGRRKTKGRPRPSYISRKHEVYYTKELLAISKQCKKEGDEIFDIVRASGQLEVLSVGDKAFDGIAIGDAPSWLTSIKSVVFGGISRKIKGTAGKIASKVVLGQSNSTDLELGKQLKDMTGVNAQALIKSKKLGKVIDNSITANVALIESIPTQYHERLERLVLVAVQNGKPQSWLEHQIKRLGKSTDARAKLIARDQISKVNTAVNKERHRQLGITHYRWRTCRDERVRHKHKEREGEIFAWDTPPDDGEGHAGEPINCRCTPEPVIGDD